MTVGGESNHSLTAAKKLNIHTDADAEIDADGQMTVASQKICMSRVRQKWI